jgi:hypothetical protein
LEKYKSPGSGEIPAELIQAGSEILLSAIHKLVNFVWNKEELPNQWKEFGIEPWGSIECWETIESPLELC